MNLATVILILGLIYFCWVWPAFRYLCLVCLLLPLLGGGWWVYGEIQKQRRYEAIVKADREQAELEAVLKKAQARIAASEAEKKARERAAAEAALSEAALKALGAAKEAAAQPKTIEVEKAALPDQRPTCPGREVRWLDGRTTCWPYGKLP